MKKKVKTHPALSLLLLHVGVFSLTGPWNAAWVMFHVPRVPRVRRAFSSLLLVSPSCTGRQCSVEELTWRCWHSCKCLQDGPRCVSSSRQCLLFCMCWEPRAFLLFFLLLLLLVQYHRSQQEDSFSVWRFDCLYFPNTHSVIYNLNIIIILTKTHWAADSLTSVTLQNVPRITIWRHFKVCLIYFYTVEFSV